MSSQPEEDEVELVSVYETLDESRLPVIKSLLAASEIPFLVQGEHSVVGAVGFRSPSLAVLVPVQHKKEAIRVLEARIEDDAL